MDKTKLPTDIALDTIAHTYTRNGEVYTPVSRWMDRFVPPFEKDRIAEATAIRDGLEAQDIIDKWDLKGDYSRHWGTALHGAIEYLIKYGELPDSPFLKEIIEDFTPFLKDEYKYISERMVYSDSERIAGTIDIIEVTKDHVVNLFDIKTTTNPEKTFGRLLPPFDDLPNSPLSKYRLQLSKYKQLIEEMAEVKVENLGAYVLQEDGWKLYEIEPLDLSILN